MTKSANLRIVKDSESPAGDIQLLALSGSAPCRVRIRERDVVGPQISLSLADCLEGTGSLVETTVGPLAEVRLALLFKGRKRDIAGAGTILSPGYDVVLPLGTLAKWKAEAA